MMSFQLILPRKLHYSVLLLGLIDDEITANPLRTKRHHIDLYNLAIYRSYEVLVREVCRIDPHLRFLEPTSHRPLRHFAHCE